MIEATISSLLESSNRTLLSYEFFPPKTEAGFTALDQTIAALATTRPDFVTVTYGAGGSTRDSSQRVCENLRQNNLSPVMPHLTCVGNTRDELNAIADQFFDQGYRNIMTLRGDPPKGQSEFITHENGLSSACELVELLKARHPEFCCGVAGYPETHPEATSAEDEIAYLKKKVEAGADFITTQMFFDNQHHYRFVEACRASGIEAPIFPGLLPALSLAQVQRFTKLCGCSFPEKLAQEMEAAGGEGPEAERIGMAWFVQQIKDLLEFGVPGIHLYVLNRPRTLEDPNFVKVMNSF